MQFLNWSSMRMAFKALCILTTISMIIYWVCKFQDNEDVSVIEYKSVEEMDYVILPEITICIESLFINEMLIKIKEELNAEGYSNYLRGDLVGNESYQLISYENVTLDLFEHMDYLEVEWKSIYNKTVTACTSILNCSFVVTKNNLNVFMSKGYFYKCFGLSIPNSYAKKVRSISVAFNSDLRSLLTKVGSAYITLGQPQQLLQTIDHGQHIWYNPNKTAEMQIFTITMLEILKRRNKPTQPCFADWRTFDDYVLKQHIENAGCRPPYMKPHKNISICNTQKKMKSAILDWPRCINNYSAPCEGISNLAYNFISMPIKPKAKFNFHFDPLRLAFYISYPDKIKVITQNRLVDGQGLVGYIGGYVGLFLGKIGTKIDQII